MVFEPRQEYGCSSSREAYTGKLAVYKIIEALAGIGVGGAQVVYGIFCKPEAEKHQL